MAQESIENFKIIRNNKNNIVTLEEIEKLFKKLNNKDEKILQCEKERLQYSKEKEKDLQLKSKQKI